MKKTLYLSLLAGCLITLGACEGSEYDLKNQIPERFHKILYLDVSGKQELTLYNTDEDNVYTFSIIKAGSEADQTTANAEIGIMTQEVVDNDYSDLEGINYKVISESAYSLDMNRLDFTSADRYKFVNVSLNPQKVLEAMENDPTANWVLPMYVTSQSDSINANKNVLFLQLKEVITPTVGFNNTDIDVKEYTYGRVSTIEEKIPFKLDTDNKWDIECQFNVNSEYITNYNAANGTVFKMIPENLYSFSKTISLSNGITESNQPITVEGDQLTPGDYMLPVQIESVSQFEISGSRNLYPMAIRIMGTQFDRSNWTAEASTEEPNGEGAGNGVAGCILDDDIKTFWHTQWQGEGANPPVPHTIIIDTKSEHTFTQFALIHRENVYYTKGGEFYVSSDLNNWGEKVGSFTMKQENGSQVFGINQATGRYIKILITESNRGEGLATLAEFYAYGLK